MLIATLRRPMLSAVIQKHGLTAVLDGKIVEGGTVPLYDGDYVVTPKTTAQTLPTANTRMAEDVSILQIPYFEVSNQTGKTVYIGKELE